MPCGSCGGANRTTSDWQVTVAGSVVTSGGTNGDGRFTSSAEARLWIARNVKGQAATIKAVPKIK